MRSLQGRAHDESCTLCQWHESVSDVTIKAGQNAEEEVEEEISLYPPAVGAIL
jgi:hypothetical protein